MGAASLGCVVAPILANAEWGIAHQPRAMVRKKKAPVGFSAYLSSAGASLTGFAKSILVGTNRVCYIHLLLRRALERRFNSPHPLEYSNMLAG